MSDGNNHNDSLIEAIRRWRRSRRRYGGPMGFLRLYVRHLRQYMTTGLLVWVPFFVTVWVCWFVITKVGFAINAFMERVVNYAIKLGHQVPFLSFLADTEYYPWMGIGLALALFLSTGFFARYLLARKVIAAGEYLLRRIPLISRIYMAVQQIRDAFVNRDKTVFSNVVMVQYPRLGVWMIGFETSREPGLVQQALQAALVAVFVPTTPNPTSGFLLYLTPEELVPLDISVEDAMKLIISGGALNSMASAEFPRAENEEEDGRMEQDK